MALDGDSFVELVVWKNVQHKLPEDIVDTTWLIRKALVMHCTDVMITSYAHLTVPDEATEESTVLHVLDTVSGVAIIMNGLAIGISMDVDWPGLDYIELGFTMFFLLEVIIRTRKVGCKYFFCGEGWRWNWFDSIIVGMAVFDLMLAHVSAVSADLGDFTIMRLARFARLSRLMRLLRVLRFRIFKELLLMINGVFAGVRTIFWAIVILITLIYGLSVLLRQTIGMAGVSRHDEYDTIIFGDMCWSMFMIFRCLMLDGSLPDGTSLVGHLYGMYGPLFGAPYVLMILFIVFGIVFAIMSYC